MTLPAVQELRALDVFDHIPAGLQTMAVDCDRNSPHLRRGETAVFDPDQRPPIHGELFVFEYSNGFRSISSTERRLMTGVWLTRDEPGDLTVPRYVWWTCPLNRRGMHMSDGPTSFEGVGHNIIGRVVGVYMGQEVQS